MAQIDLKDAILTVQDGSTNSLELHIGEGNLEWTEKRNIEYVLNRGELGFLREGDEAPVEVSFEFIWDFLTSDTTDGEPPTMKEALTQSGPCAGWESSSNDTLQPYTVNIVVNYLPPCPGIDREIIIITQFCYEELAHSSKEAKVVVKGKANITKVTSTREAR